MFVQRKYERENDTQVYLQHKNERDNATQAYLQRKGDRENANTVGIAAVWAEVCAYTRTHCQRALGMFGSSSLFLTLFSVTLAMVMFHFLWNRSPPLPSCKELRSNKTYHLERLFPHSSRKQRRSRNKDTSSHMLIFSVEYLVSRED